MKIKPFLHEVDQHGAVVVPILLVRVGEPDQELGVGGKGVEVVPAASSTDSWLPGGGVGGNAGGPFFTFTPISSYMFSLISFALFFRLFFFLSMTA